MGDAKTHTNLQEQASATSPALEQTLSSEAVLDALKMILLGAPLNEVLTRVTRLIETHSKGMMCSIFLLDEDGSHLRYAATAANLPEAYRAATDGVCIGPNVGSCGAAAYLGKPVFVSDMVSHPNWANFRGVVLQSGLRAAWSTPIMSHDGKVLGTFCMYYREARHPSPGEIRLIDYASHIAGIAIERDRSQAALQRAYQEIKQSEGRLRRIIDTIPTLAWCSLPDGKGEFWNQRWHDYTGLSPEAVRGWGWQDAIHPEDLKEITDKWLGFLASGQSGEVEGRLRRFDGVYRWFLFRAEPLRDKSGNIVNWYGTDTDIDDRKRAEGELEKAFEEIKRLKDRLHDENVVLREQIDQVSMFEEIVGSSPALKTVLSSILKVAPTDSTVLIMGETGTGKELIARAIHKGSQRAGQTFITVNCGAIPPSLIASELFGHEKGAFTGALQRRQGRFELAHSGTIFLDEIGELPAETQIALLRVLQERQFERVGGNRALSTDVRVIAATNRDLAAAIASGTFRADLFYRLNVFPIHVPPLRNRKEDIPMLVEYFVKRYAEKARKQISKIDKNTLRLCQSYPWPGNIRELQNIIERSVILCTGDTFWIEEAWLSSPDALGTKPSGPLTENLQNYERGLIESALAESIGKIAGPNGAAAKLGIPPSTLHLKIKQLNIKKSTIQ
jgi:formate hydrogenlyase transcriptional activator